jgi:hypothetical protein
MGCIDEHREDVGVVDTDVAAGSEQRQGVVVKDGLVRRGESGPVFFYGCRKKNGYLSQMYMSGFEEDGKTYLCNEQYFQAAKAAFFRDKIREGLIMKLKSPYAMKSVGRKVTPFSVERWKAGAWSKLFWGRRTAMWLTIRRGIPRRFACKLCEVCAI